MWKQIKLPLLVTEILLYAVTIFFGLMVSERLKLFSPLRLGEPQFSLGQFFLFFFLATGVFLFSMRLFKTGLIWQFIFALAIFSGTQVVFSLALPDFWSVFFAITLVVIRFISPTVFWQNLAVCLSIAGVSSVFGLSLNPYSVVVILLVLSVYDYIAVYTTQHMVKMASAMINYHAILAFIIPEKIISWNENLNRAKPGEGFMVLGGGDVALPLIMVISSSLLSLRHGILVGFFVLLGVIATHLIFVSQKQRRPMPALPPMAFFSILGFFVSLVVL